MARTNVVLDDELIERAKELSGLKTKREVIHEALRTFVRLHEQARIREMRGALRWEGDLDRSREGRMHAVS